MASSDHKADGGYPAFLGSEFEPPRAEDAFFHVLPIPFERSVSYGGGTADGPRSILEASWQLETWDGRSEPARLGIHTHPPVDCGGTSQQVIDAIAAAARGIFEQEKFFVGLGGEHTVTYGVIRGLLDAGIDDFGVVQIDAHADLREAYEGDPLSHASVMKRIVDEDIPVFQLGIRALSKEEVEARKVHGVKYYDAEFLVTRGINKVELPDDFPDKIFFTLDIDGLDPTLFPSTGTPVPGGLGWYQTLSLFESVVNQAEVIGFDITEFAPIPGFHAYQFSAALLAYRMMGIVERSRK